jgi:3-oxoacyl-[acyl-carrier protein] reductase
VPFERQSRSPPTTRTSEHPTSPSGRPGAVRRAPSPCAATRQAARPFEPGNGPRLVVAATRPRAGAAVVETFGGIDILVNNAGFGRFAPLVEQDVESFEAVFRTNVTGAMVMAREAARHFVAQESGHLINVSSTSGVYGGKGATAYSGSKFALRGMTECWRAELRPHNVRVMLVNPSEVQTPFFEKLGRTQELSEKKLRPDEIAAAIVGALEIDDRGFIPELSVFATNPW